MKLKAGQEIYLYKYTGIKNGIKTHGPQLTRVIESIESTNPLIIKLEMHGGTTYEIQSLNTSSTVISQYYLKMSGNSFYIRTTSI